MVLGMILVCSTIHIKINVECSYSTKSREIASKSFSRSVSSNQSLYISTGPVLIFLSFGKINLMSAENEDLAVVLLGYTGRDLWFVVNFVILGWLPLFLLPRWKHTPTIPLFPALFHALVYTISIIAAIKSSPEKADFSTFDGVHKMLSDPNVTLPAWIHYCMADLLIGRWIYLDSIKRGASLPFHFLVIVPCLFLTLMLCPCGFLLYMAVIRELIPSGSSKEESNEKSKKG